MSSIIYRDNYIFPHADGTFTGTCLNEDGDVISKRMETLESIKEWIDLHLDNKFF